MRIKSKTDVITNSSNEVFAYRMGTPRYAKMVSVVGQGNFLELTEETLKEYVLDPNYYGWDLDRWAQVIRGDAPSSPSRDPLGDSHGLVEVLRGSGKTDEEIWEFFKPIYQEMINTAIASWSNEGGSSETLKKAREEDYNWELQEKISTVNNLSEGLWRIGNAYLRVSNSKPRMEAIVPCWYGGVMIDNSDSELWEISLMELPLEDNAPVKADEELGNFNRIKNENKKQD